jgi:hypothetical protein
MWIYADYLQVTGEVSERNRLFRALNEIKEIALLNSSKELSPELQDQLRLIAQKCDDALSYPSSSQK